MRCWVCLEGALGPSPCACPSHVHPVCLALWQMHCSGTPEETRCRFCGGAYPDWRGVIGPRSDFYEVTVSDVTKRFGSEGLTLEAFRKKLRAEFALSRRAPLHISFDIPIPNTDRRVQLEGWSKYDAAMAFVQTGNVTHS